MSEFKEETNLYEDTCKQINELTPEELEQVNGGEELYDPPYAPDPPQIHGGPHHMGPGMIGPINISQDDIWLVPAACSWLVCPAGISRVRLHEGKNADYLVFEKSLMEMDPKEIRDTMPESVYLCGELYQK